MWDVSAIVVTYNSESEIGACLDALAPCGEAIVVDNASADGSVAVATGRPGVEVIANSSNRGFAAAVNQGARSARHRHLLLMNPDAVLTTDCESLIQACERSGIAAGCLTNAEGKPQAGFTIRRLPTRASLLFECLGLNRIWPGNPVNARYRYNDLDLSKPARVEQPAGAFLMIRRDVFFEIGGFDERFWPVWYEDVDFCRRAREAGFTIEYTPEARARHSGAHSLENIDIRQQRLYWYGSLLKYVDKHYRPITLRAVSCAIVLGSCLRWLAGMTNWHRRERLGEYSNVLRLAAASFFAGRLVRPAAADIGRVAGGTEIRQVVDEN